MTFEEFMENITQSKQKRKFIKGINRFENYLASHAHIGISQSNKKEVETNNNEAKDPTPEYYGAKCKCGRKMDWYVIGDAYRKNKGEAWSHACKKLLRAGEGHKPLLKDINEVIDTLNRWKEQLENDRN